MERNLRNAPRRSGSGAISEEERRPPSRPQRLPTPGAWRSDHFFRVRHVWQTSALGCLGGHRPRAFGLAGGGGQATLPSSAVLALPGASRQSADEEEPAMTPTRLLYDFFLGSVSALLLLLNVVEWLIPDDNGGSSGVLNDMLLKIIIQADNVICGLFLVDFFVRHALPGMQGRRGRPRRLLDLAGAAVDLALCIPRCVLENGGVFSAMRVAREFRILQVMRVLMATRQIGTVLRDVRALSVVVLVAFLSFTVWLLGAIGVLAFEFGVAGSSIRTAEDALWWSAATITTVGYGDVVPTTSGGRIIAFLLMLGGVSVYGATSALITSFIMGQANKENEARLHRQERERKERSKPKEGSERPKAAKAKPKTSEVETAHESSGPTEAVAAADSAERQPPASKLRHELSALREEMAAQGESIQALHKDVAELSKLVARLAESKPDQ